MALPTLFFSCSKDDDAKNLTREEASTAIQSTSTNLKQEISGIETNKGVTTIKTLVELTPDGLFPDAVESVASSDGMVKLLASRSNPLMSPVAPAKSSFNFAKHSGKYTYSKGEFVHSSDVTDKIVYLFPSTKTGTKNNAELTISAYSEQYIQSKEEYVPTKIEAELKVDGAVVFKFSYKAAIADLNLDGIASSGVASYDLSITAAPYTLESHQSFSATETGYKTTDNSFLKNGSTTIISTGRNLAANINVEKETVSISGNAFAQLSNLKLEGKISYSGTMAEALDGENIYSKINLTLYTYPAGDKIGTVLVTENSENDEPMIAYNDGTKATVVSVFGNLFNELFPDFN